MARVLETIIYASVYATTVLYNAYDMFGESSAEYFALPFSTLQLILIFTYVTFYIENHLHKIQPQNNVQMMYVFTIANDIILKLSEAYINS